MTVESRSFVDGTPRSCTRSVEPVWFKILRSPDGALVSGPGVRFVAEMNGPVGRTAS